MRWYTKQVSKLVCTIAVRIPKPCTLTLNDMIRHIFELDFLTFVSFNCILTIKMPDLQMQY